MSRKALRKGVVGLLGDALDVTVVPLPVLRRQGGDGVVGFDLVSEEVQGDEHDPDANSTLAVEFRLSLVGDGGVDDVDRMDDLLERMRFVLAGDRTLRGTVLGCDFVGSESEVLTGDEGYAYQVVDTYQATYRARV